nr:MAG TPA: hypothetical protein [Caudoviricetes sp.]
MINDLAISGNWQPFLYLFGPRELASNSQIIYHT